MQPRIFAADAAANAAMADLQPNVPEGARTPGALIEAAIGRELPIDVYSYVTGPELVRALARHRSGPVRLLLRFPEGFDESVASELERHPALMSGTKVYDRPGAAGVHAKLYVIHLQPDRRLVLVGSSNATKAGLWHNLETNIALVVVDGASTRDPSVVFDELWTAASLYDPHVHCPQPMVALDAPLLFEYQREAIDELKQLLEPIQQGRWRRGSQVPGAMISLPTAAGKTVVATRFVLEHVLPTHSAAYRRVLWLADTDEQVSQAHDSFTRQVRLELRSSLRTFRLTTNWKGAIGPLLDAHDVVFATRSLVARRLEAEPGDRPASFHVIVIDEAHHVHASNEQYPEILKRIGHAARIGLSATPHRHPAEEDPGLYAYFNPVPSATARLTPAFSRELHELQHAEHRGVRIFARPQYEQVRTKFTIDLAKTGLNESKLRRLPFHDADRIKRIVASYDRQRHTPAMFFAVDIPDANALTRGLIERGVRAQVVHTGVAVEGCLFSQSHPLTRSQRLDVVRALGDPDDPLEAIVNVEVFIEGVDIPGLKSVFLARPTFSSRVYLQMCGRALRGPAMNGTAECVIVELEENVLHESGGRQLMNAHRALGRESAGEDPDTATPLETAPVDWRELVDADPTRRIELARQCLLDQGELDEEELPERLVEILMRVDSEPRPDRSAIHRAALDIVRTMVRRASLPGFVRTRAGKVRFKVL